MTLRSVHDTTDVEWRVWDVRPSWAASTPSGPSGPALAPPPGTSRRLGLAPHLAAGWLAIQSAHGERRRLVPIPDGWHDLSDAALLALVERAAVQPAGRRRLVE